MTRLFAKSHEWVEETGEGTVKIGISNHAQEAMGDLVFVNLPEVGDQLAAGDVFADVESVKAVSDIYAPASGVVKAVNEDLLDAPETINQAPYEAWFVELEDYALADGLMSEDDYLNHVAEEA